MKNVSRDKRVLKKLITILAIGGIFMSGIFRLDCGNVVANAKSTDIYVVASISYTGTESDGQEKYSGVIKYKYNDKGLLTKKTDSYKRVNSEDETTTCKIVDKYSYKSDGKYIKLVHKY